MDYARKIVAIYGFTQLKIPKAMLSEYENFLFEERIAFNSNIIEQTRLSTVYAQDKAVREFCKFVLLTNLWDIVLFDREHECLFPWIRFDNFPFYLDSKAGQPTLKIGLIDLERISVKRGVYYKMLPSLIYVFPHSEDLILEEAIALGVVSKENLDEIKNKFEENKNLGLQHKKLWHSDLISYIDYKKSLKQNFEDEVKDKFDQIYQAMIKEFELPEKTHITFKAYLEEFMKALINIKTEETKYKSIYGEVYTKTNSAFLDRPVKKESKAFEKEWGNGEWLTTKQFLKTCVDHKLIYYFFEQGYRLNIIFQTIVGYECGIIK